MPQIWPMNWVLLFLLFTLTFIVFAVLTYFFYVPVPAPKNSKNFSSPKSLPWSW